MAKPIVPFLWFNNQAQEAAVFYTSIFPKSKIVSSNPFVTMFRLNGRDFAGMNGGPQFPFTEAVSFAIFCDTQEEIDYYWKKLSAKGKIQRCGWLKDRYGVSWQVVPTILASLIGGGDPEKAGRATKAMMGMKKLNIAKLVKAHEGPKRR